MLFHASLPARDPARAARIVAELWRGTAYLFPPFPDSYIVFANDGRGTGLEFYPAGRVLVPGETDVRMIDGEAGETESHVAIGVPLSEAEVHTIAAREGWKCFTCSRGGMFRVIEVWIENTLMIEALTPAMQAEYLSTMTAANWGQTFGIPPLPEAA